MATLTVFTPTYNRAHTLPRTYESLLRQTCKDFEWLVIDDGSTDGTEALVVSWIAAQNTKENGLKIRYIYKENGGLYTGYNTAYANIDTELSVCIDSDDFMPDDAVEKILNCWYKNSDIHDQVCGIEGLDFDVRTSKPIGGFFNIPEKDLLCYKSDLKHKGDTKQVLRTSLMKEVAPMDGFPGEKDFNPYYMIMQVVDKYPMLVLNENLCWVEYQIGLDSMSQGIYKQYVRSPRSFAKYRLMQMKMKRRPQNFSSRLRLHIHYVSSCLLSKNFGMFRNSPEKIKTLLAFPLGLLLTVYLKVKTR